jgi:hypothetical protein
MNFSEEQIANMHLYDFKKETDHATDLGLQFQTETGLILLPEGEEDCAGFVTYDDWDVKEYMYDYKCDGCGKTRRSSAIVTGMPCDCGGLFGRL